MPSTRGTAVQPLVHADDCGLTPGITAGILACHDHGALQRTSVIVNGSGWEQAVEGLRVRPALAVVLHLNLFEGQPISPPGEVDRLVDPRGQFHHGFAGLWRRASTGADRHRVGAQIGLELRRQIERYVTAFGDRRPRAVDSHVHYHLLPPVWSVLQPLLREYAITEIRLPREPLYWPAVSGAPRPALINVVKNRLLDRLCRTAARDLAADVRTSTAFLGVLGTGGMTLGHVRSGLEWLRRRGVGGQVEILFHPGRATAGEASQWRDRPALGRSYLSAARDDEAAVVRSGALAALLHEYGGRPADDGRGGGGEVSG